MSFTSLEYWIFLPIVFGAYYICPKRRRWICLLTASCVFYGFAGIQYVLLLVYVTLAAFLAARSLEKTDHISRWWMAAGVCAVILPLIVFKYTGFLTENLNILLRAMKSARSLSTMKIIQPLGISFYSFAALGYVIDVAKKKYPAFQNPLHLAAGLSFFPCLVSGPIERQNKLVPQILEGHDFDYAEASYGLKQIAWGLFQKKVLADNLAVYADAVYADVHAWFGAPLLAASLFYTMMIYCDFAGYSEIAAGSARLMGVRLMKNFDQPYLSQSYGEFFRRWHISLNRWFTSYVYIPLGGSRRGTARRMLNTLIVFTLCGLWHGARWNYVLWGLYAALWVCVEGLLEKTAGRLAEKWRLPLSAPWFVWLRRGIMFLIFVPAGLIFRASSLEQVGVVFHRLLTAPGSAAAALQSMNLTGLNAIRLILTLLAMARLRPWGEADLPGAKTGRDSARKMVSAVYFLLIIACAWLALLATQDAAEFAYFQF